VLYKHGKQAKQRELQDKAVPCSQFLNNSNKKNDDEEDGGGAGSGDNYHF
jgi:hypothetical protein